MYTILSLSKEELIEQLTKALDQLAAAKEEISFLKDLQS